MIRLQNINKRYPTEAVTAVRDLSLIISPGESIALMGPSGCGKTTLLNLIGAMDVPSSGEILFEGKPLGSYRPHHAYRANVIGFIFQFHHLIPSLTLRENVELPMYPLRISAAVRAARAAGLLESIGLGERINFYPHRVSGGERQRAAIARGLANNPRLILADEPTGSVDSETGEQVIGFLLDQCRETGAALVMATHNPTISAMADRVLQMRDGQIVLD